MSVRFVVGAAIFAFLLCCAVVVSAYSAEGGRAVRRSHSAALQNAEEAIARLRMRQRFRAQVMDGDGDSDSDEVDDESDADTHADVDDDAELDAEADARVGDVTVYTADGKEEFVKVTGAAIDKIGLKKVLTRALADNKPAGTYAVVKMQDSSYRVIPIVDKHEVHDAAVVAPVLNNANANAVDVQDEKKQVAVQPKAVGAVDAAALSHWKCAVTNGFKYTALKQVPDVAGVGAVIGVISWHPMGKLGANKDKQFYLFSRAFTGTSSLELEYSGLVTPFNAYDNKPESAQISLTAVPNDHIITLVGVYPHGLFSLDSQMPYIEAAMNEAFTLGVVTKGKLTDEAKFTTDQYPKAEALPMLQSTWSLWKYGVPYYMNKNAFVPEWMAYENAFGAGDAGKAATVLLENQKLWVGLKVIANADMVKELKLPGLLAKHKDVATLVEAAYKAGVTSIRVLLSEVVNAKGQVQPLLLKAFGSEAALKAAVEGFHANVLVAWPDPQSNEAAVVKFYADALLNTKSCYRPLDPKVFDKITAAIGLIKKDFTGAK